jgi:hypothetical protein
MRKLITYLFLSCIFAASSTFAMYEDSISIEKSTVLKAFDSHDKILELNGRKYKVDGYVGGSFGHMFRDQPDRHLYFYHQGNKWSFLEDAGPVFDPNDPTKEISPGMDGVANLTLEKIK